MPRAQHVSGKSGRFRVQPEREAALIELARRQHWVVELGQLRELGFGAEAGRKRATTGRLHRVHRGVYAVGRPTLSAHGRWMAATLACGAGALLSHRSAAALWELHAGGLDPCAVTLPSPSVRQRHGVRVYRSTTLSAADRAEQAGIPCTSVARTLVDFAGVARRREVERAFEQAEVLRLFDLRAIDDALTRAGPRRGTGLVRAILRAAAGPTLTRSELEERFLALCRAGALPSPAVNAWITLDHGVAFQVDFLWRDAGLVVETDGYAFHSSRAAFERDRRRDRLLKLHDLEVLHFTWREVVEEPGQVLEAVRALLARLARP